jgi:hypothetical protein
MRSKNELIKMIKTGKAKVTRYEDLHAGKDTQRIFYYLWVKGEPRVELLNNIKYDLFKVQLRVDFLEQCMGKSTDFWITKYNENKTEIEQLIKLRGI